MIIINTWVGGLGNNIIQVVNSILIAYKFKHKFIKMPKDTNKFNWYHKKYLTLYNVIFKDIIITEFEQNKKIISNNFFSRRKLFEKLNIKKDYNIPLTKILKLIKIPIKRIKSNNNDLIIHIRSGDVFTYQPHAGFYQPPLNYYKKIINLKKWDNIRIIAQDNNNPVIPELIKLYPNIKLKFQTLIEDISYIIGSKNICFGKGSFISSLLLFNSNLVNIYYPEYCERYINDYLDCNKTITKLPNYIKIWKNTIEQKKIMLTYKL